MADQFHGRGRLEHAVLLTGAYNFRVQGLRFLESRQNMVHNTWKSLQKGRSIPKTENQLKKDWKLIC